MDPFQLSVEVMSMASLVLLMLMTTNRALAVLSEAVAEEESADVSDFMETNVEPPALDVNDISQIVLMHFRLWNSLSSLDEDLGFWVKPRSTTWFSRFLLEEYDDHRWVQLFRMTKQALFSLTNILAPHIRRRDTNYRLAVPVVVRIACALFKLSHGSSLLICSEMFAVGRSSVCIFLREVVQSVNVVLRHEVSWPRGEEVADIAAGFKQLCGLPAVLGAVDGTHFGIKKPSSGSADYYYFKSGSFTINCQAVVDSSKRFLDIFVGMPGCTNDARMLRRSSLFQKGQSNELWNSETQFEGFAPYLLADSGYPLLPWIMGPHRRQSNLSVSEQLFNRKLSRGRGVVENAFAFLKTTFKELLLKSDLSVIFLPDVVAACAILHNVLLKQSHEEVERLLHILEIEGYRGHEEMAASTMADASAIDPEQRSMTAALTKRRDLGGYLALQRIVPT